MLRRCLVLFIIAVVLVLTGCPVGPEIQVMEIRITTTAKSSVISLDSDGVGTLKLDAEVLPAEASVRAVTWSSSDPASATVDNTGLVSATAIQEDVEIIASVGGIQCIHIIDIQAGPTKVVIKKPIPMNG